MEHNNEELRRQNNAKIQSYDSEHVSRVAKLLQDASGSMDVSVSRAHVMPTPLQMEIRANTMNADELAEKVFGDTANVQQANNSFYNGMAEMREYLSKEK